MRESFTKFRLDFIPNIVFIGAYIQPENSLYFNVNMFSELSELLIDIKERNLTPILGGDLNCRYGNLNQMFGNGSILYNENIDKTSNHHGRTFGADLCKVGLTFPVNHLIHGNKNFAGNHTYYKGNKKSQIDFLYTNSDGIKYFNKFEIISDNWHLSDHCPILAECNIPEIINCAFILRRAKDLNYAYDPHKTKIVRYLANYDKEKFSDRIKELFPIIESSVLKEIQNKSIEKAMNKLDHAIDEIYKFSKLRRNPSRSHEDYRLMNDANTKFDNLRKCINGEIEGNIEELSGIYQNARNLVTKEIHYKEHMKWKSIIEDNNPKRLWKKIDWKGNVNRQVDKSPVIEDLAVHFQSLYQNERNEAKAIENLQTDQYVPYLDNPISNEEIKKALDNLKNGGFDHKLEYFKILFSTLSPLLLIIMNIFFYITFPVKLALSLLTAIPKKGNLSLPKNYRGIQMLKSMAALYDRIITNCLEQWIINIICNKQSAYLLLFIIFSL